MPKKKEEIVAVEIRIRKIMEPYHDHDTTRVQLLCARYGGGKEWKTLEYKYSPAPQAVRKLIRFAVQELEKGGTP